MSAAPEWGWGSHKARRCYPHGGMLCCRHISNPTGPDQSLSVSRALVTVIPEPQTRWTRSQCVGKPPRCNRAERPGAPRATRPMAPRGQWASGNARSVSRSPVPCGAAHARSPERRPQPGGQAGASLFTTDNEARLTGLTRLTRRRRWICSSCLSPETEPSPHNRCSRTEPGLGLRPDGSCHQ